MSPSNHVVYYVHDRADALARARAILPHLRGRATVVAQATTPGLDHRLPGLVVTGRQPEPRDRVTVARPALVGGSTEVTTVSDHLDPNDILDGLLQALAADLVVVDGGFDAWRVADRSEVPVVAVRGPSWAWPAVSTTTGPAAWLAPFPAILDRNGAPPTVQQHTLYAGLLSPSNGSRLTRAAARRRLGLDVHGRHLTIALGSDGEPLDAERVLAAAQRAPQWSFSVVGRDGGPAGTSSSERVWFEPDGSRLLQHLVAADAVLSAGSLDLLAEVAAVRRPLAILAGAAGAGEDPVLGETLEAIGAAILLPSWPPDVAWPALLAELLDHPTRPLAHLDDGRGPRRAAAWLDGWAAETPIAAAVS
jgi:hypothetical protein